MNYNTESVLQKVSSFITVNEGEIKDTNPHLRKILDVLTDAMKAVSPLFKGMFETYLYSGSSFDGLKIGKPDEYDIDLKLHLPKMLDVQIEPSDRDGFVFVNLKHWNRFTKDPNYKTYKPLEKYKDSESNLLSSQTGIKEWLKSVIDSAKVIIENDNLLDSIQFTRKESGPAITLKVVVDSKKISIDLVPVFRIPGKKWPTFSVRKNSTTKPDYLIVPKPPKEENLSYDKRRYWRLSFPEQEKQLMHDFQRCKPIIRLLKQLRDKYNHNIPSYYIKTIFLWEIKKRERSFWNCSLTYIFLEMLQTYQKYIEDYNIPYFWSEKNNFLENHKKETIFNIQRCIQKMMNKIEKYRFTNPEKIAEYLLSTEDYARLFNKFEYQSSSISSYNIDTDSDEHEGFNRIVTQEEGADNVILATTAVLGIGAVICGIYSLFRSNRND